MPTSSPIEELDACKYLYVESISEPEANALRLVISEGIVSENTETLRVDAAEISDVHAVEVTEASRWFEVLWPTYVAYSIRNESFCVWDEEEHWTGAAFRIYSVSKFLDFVATGTFADFDYPGKFSHYGIVCSDHVIDVASVNSPTVSRIGTQPSAGSRRGRQFEKRTSSKHSGA